MGFTDPSVNMSQSLTSAPKGCVFYFLGIFSPRSPELYLIRNHFYFLQNIHVCTHTRLAPYICGNRWERVRFSAPPTKRRRARSLERVPLATPRRMVSGSHETWDWRYSSQSRIFATVRWVPPSLNVLLSSSIVEEFVISDRLAERVNYVSQSVRKFVSISEGTFILFMCGFSSIYCRRRETWRNWGHVKRVRKKANFIYDTLSRTNINKMCDVIEKNFQVKLKYTPACRPARKN